MNKKLLLLLPLLLSGCVNYYTRPLEPGEPLPYYTQPKYLPVWTPCYLQPFYMIDARGRPVLVQRLVCQ